ncbi:MAG TPA: chemotaxis protein CheR, partial [Anaerolineae bacterium]|nr:chemotaxis protein CheR [Anaerolineae bacterium]
MNDREYAYVRRKVQALFDIDLSQYKEEQMRRRLHGYLQRTGAKTWAEYMRRLESDVAEQARFQSYLTINVSSFFRDADRFQQLSEQILPELLRRSSRLAVWSAGCSHGGEPYTLAILLKELAPHRQHHIWATDIDRNALRLACAGGPYPHEAVKEVPPALLLRYFVHESTGYHVVPSLRRLVSFKRHNLLEDP